MTPEHAPSTPDSRANPRLDPAAIPVSDAAKVLSRAGGVAVTKEQLAADIDAGAPTNRDGSLHLLHYAAWLVREMATGGATIGD